MLLIHHARATRSLRVVWQCEEMGLAYEITPVSLRRPDPAFLQINPLGGVPVLQDGDTRVIESLAIMLYLAGRHGPTELALEPHDPAYGDYLQFLMVGETAMGSAINMLMLDRYRCPAEEKGAFLARTSGERLERALGLLRGRLEGRDYLAADRFTLADISTGFALTVVSRFLGMGETIGPELCAYRDRLTSRPAFQRADAK